MVWYSVVQWTDTQPITPILVKLLEMVTLTLHTTRVLNITAVTTNTITINVGTASDDQTITGKFPAVHTQGTYEFLVQETPTPTLSL